MKTSCLIHFNNFEGVYNCGEIVSGVVELTTFKEKTIRAIYITVEGFAKVKWTRHGAGQSSVASSQYKGHEQYLSSKTYVVNERESRIRLAPARYSYEFQFPLPHHLPSSFEGKYGHISYQVKLTIDRPWKFDNVFEKKFSVKSAVNLNMYSELKFPKHIENGNHFCGLFCCFQPLTAKAVIPYSGFISEQEIPISIFIRNPTAINCTNVKISLQRHDKYTTQTPKKDTRQVVKNIKIVSLGDVPRRSRKAFNVNFEIPKLPTSSFGRCSIIDIKYSLNISVHTPGINRKLQLKIPIFIGTIPLGGSETISENVELVASRRTRRAESNAPPPYEIAIISDEPYTSKYSAPNLASWVEAENKRR